MSLRFTTKSPDYPTIERDLYNQSKKLRKTKKKLRKTKEAVNHGHYEIARRKP